MRCQPSIAFTTHFILKRLIFYAIWIFQYKKTVVFCSFRIKVQTLQISGKELFVYVKFKKKLILRFQQRYQCFDSIFFTTTHTYINVQVTISLSSFLLYKNLGYLLFVFVVLYMIAEKSYWLLLLDSIYSKPEGNHYGIFISRNIELTTETVCM